jgi:hypothetical protein
MTILKNNEYGIAAQVYQNARGQWVVRLIDTDADEILPVLKLFDTEDKALAFAQQCIA